MLTHISFIFSVLGYLWDHEVHSVKGWDSTAEPTQPCDESRLLVCQARQSMWLTAHTSVSAAP
jgi:hypothetical protein